MNITLCISSQDWIILQRPNNNCYQCTNHFKNNGYQCAGDKSIFVPRLKYRATHYTVEYSIGSIRSERCLFLSVSHSLSRWLCIVVIYSLRWKPLSLENFHFVLGDGVFRLRRHLAFVLEAVSFSRSGGLDTNARISSTLRRGDEKLASFPCRTPSLTVS